MGRVWRATDVVLHREVAIKELVPPPGLTPGERQEMRERSLREARAIARLNNINVVRVFDVLRTDADPWIVMEYVPSRSLQDTLASDGPFSPVRAAEIGLGVLGALRAAHRAGVVHRDVKPGNVLLGADGRVVLTDFGLATVPGDPNVTRTGLVLGSPAYIAPERARDGTAGPGADLWSLGATLYAAVEGASPFARPSAIATLAALATENPPPARNAGPLKPVLNGLLRKDPAHRINAEEAERLLNRATGRRSKMTFPMSPTMRRPGAGRERPGALISPTGSAPVVPGPRPPVAPGRPVDPPGRPPVTGGRPAAGDGRPPVYVPGKAPVGRPTPDTPARADRPQADAPRLDATRVDTPAIKDDKTTFRTRPAPATGSGQPPAARPPARTGRTPDVASPRPVEQSLVDPTALVSRAGTPAADPTTVVGSPQTPDATTVGKPGTTTSGTGPAQRTAASTPATTSHPTTDKSEKSTTDGATSGTDQDKAAETATDVTATKGALAGGGAAGGATDRTAARSTGGAVTDDAATDDVVTGGAPTDAAFTGGAVSGGAVSGGAASGGAASGGAASGGAASGGAVSGGVASRGASRRGAAANEDAPGAATTSAATNSPATDGTFAGGAAAEETAADGATIEGAAATGSAATGSAATGGAATAGTDSAAAEAAAPDSAANAGTATDGSATAQASSSTSTPEQGQAAAGDAKQQSLGKPAIPKATGKKQRAAANKPATHSRQPAAPVSGEPSVTPTAVTPTAATPTAVTPTAESHGDAKPAATNAASRDSDGGTRTAGPGNAPVSPSIGRPSRPAWRPMEPRPLPSGVTVFGTRLTYRQAAVGAAILVLVLVLVITLIAQAVGDEEKTPPGALPTAAPTATVTAAPTATSDAKPSVAATTPPSTAPSSAPPSSSPAAPGAVALPSGWKWHNAGATGGAPAFSLPIPSNAQVSGSGQEIQFRWNNRLLILGRTTEPQADALADWKRQEAARRGTYRNYNFIRLDAVEYRGYESVADWEFEYTTSNNNRQHVLRRNIRVDGSAAYSLNWYVSADDWDAAKSDLQRLYQGFQPK
jgi:hypothetical protein